MSQPNDLLQHLEHLSAPQLRRLLTEQLSRQKLGLYWESSAIERDVALNANIVLPRLSEADSHGLAQLAGPGTPNLIIEGDNFDSLRLLKSTHAGKVRVIYIDPPYNTGNKDWVYNDRFVGVNDRWRHSQWLEFLYRRLLLARDLLTQDGVIMVSINDENRARLELLMDEVFPGRRVGSFVWRVRSGGNDTKGALLSDNHEHVLVYANAGFEFKGEGRDESAYSNPDNDSRGEWQNDNLVKAHNAKQRPEAYYPIHNVETDTWYACDPDSVWRFSSVSRPLKKKLQSDPTETILAEKRILWPGKDFPYPKPLSLLFGLLSQASRADDTVLDFFAGTGTTGHAVLALNALDGGNRKFILCSSTEATLKEPNKNVCRDVCAARVRKVIESDAALGGNSFAYLQLDKIAPGDAPFDSSCAQAFQLLTLRLGQVARPVPAADRGIKVLVQNTGDGALTVLCHKLTRAALDALTALPCRQLRVYSTRPATVREHFQALGREVESLSLARALLHGQQSARARRKPLAAALDATNSIASHARRTSANGLEGTETTTIQQESSVIPAQAGIQQQGLNTPTCLDSRLRGNDGGASEPLVQALSDSPSESAAS